MNRRFACLLFGVASFLGCGARTGTLDFGAGTPDDNGGTPNGGGPDVAGGPAFAGSPSFAGAPSFAAGAPSFGGAPSFTAGAPSFTAGAPSVGGAPSFGGFAGKGGAPSVAGAPSTGGASGGPSGSGGGGVIVDACVAIANNACDKCLCTSCSTQVVGCFSDAQCTSIFSCIVRTGCQGVGCFATNTCRNVIQNNGGLTGPAVGEVLSLVTCAVNSQTNCACN